MASPVGCTTALSLDFQTFDDYLAVFNQRRNIKRERKAVEKAGLRLQTLSGDEIPKSLFPLMYNSMLIRVTNLAGGVGTSPSGFEQLRPLSASGVVCRGLQ